VCPNKNLFSSFEKLDDCSIVMGDNRPCRIEEMGTILVKMFDGMVQELKDMRHVPQLKKNLISIDILKALGLEVSIRD